MWQIRDMNVLVLQQDRGLIIPSTLKLVAPHHQNPDF
jgi:hypothetical protein